MSDKETKTELLTLLRTGDIIAAIDTHNMIRYYDSKRAPQWALANSLSAAEVEWIRASRRPLNPM